MFWFILEESFQFYDILMRYAEEKRRPIDVACVNIHKGSNQTNIKVKLKLIISQYT